jgi:hypothetical protein
VGTVVNRDGIVCAAVFTGADRQSQWPGSRVISSQKANTANAFSLPGFALSTANLFSAVQPGGPLFGLPEGNPVDTDAAYDGNAAGVVRTHHLVEPQRIWNPTCNATANAITAGLPTNFPVGPTP